MSRVCFFSKTKYTILVLVWAGMLVFPGAVLHGTHITDIHRKQYSWFVFQGSSSIILTTNPLPIHHHQIPTLEITNCGDMHILTSNPTFFSHQQKHHHKMPTVNPTIKCHPQIHTLNPTIKWNPYNVGPESGFCQKTGDSCCTNLW